MPDSAEARAERNLALAALLSRVALGDRQAFAALYRDTSAHLFAIILRIQTDRTQAEDLLQDIYITIWRAARDFDATRGQPMTWLISIARNRAIDSLRRRRTQPATVQPSAWSEDDEGDALDRLPAEGGSPLELLVQAAEARAVTHCVGELSAEQQQCIALSYYQGFSHAEVAGHLVQPLGTVKSWLRRALQSLRDCLGASAGIDGTKA